MLTDPTPYDPGVVAEALSIFIVHPSALLTDHRPHGDGLAAHSFIAGLAARGHRLHVAVEDVDLERELGPHVTLHRVGRSMRSTALRRPRFALGVAPSSRACSARSASTWRTSSTPWTSASACSCHAPACHSCWDRTFPSGRRRRSACGTLAGSASAAPAGGHAHRGLRPYSSAEPRCCCSRLPPPRERLHRPGRARVRVLPYGIDVGSFEAPADAGAGEDGPILFLAGLEPWKGIDTLLDAFELVAGKFRTAAWRSRARDRWPSSCSGAWPHRRWESRIDVLGRVERADVPQLLARSSIYCLPSVREPFGISALEAMACGRPVVATDAGGLSHLVERRGRAARAARGRPRAGRRPEELLSSPELRRSMGEHNRRLVGERFVWERVVAQLEDAYREAIWLGRLPGRPLQNTVARG